MLTLLLADDEKLLRQGVADLTDWAGLGIGRVLQAENGVEALKLAREHKPDVLLTDVKMPQMDGIALAGAFHREFPETKIVFLSGYDDTEYLKAAIHEQAVDYILKPVDPRELYAALEKAVSELNRQQERKKQQQDMRTLIQKSLPAYRKDFFSRLLASDCDMEALQEQFFLCDFPFPAEGAFLALLVSVRYEASTSGTQIGLLAGEIENYLRDFLEQEGLLGAVYPGSHDLYLLTLFLPEQKEMKTGVYSRILAGLTSRFPVECGIGIGEPCGCIYDIRESRDCAELALSQQFHGGWGQVYRYEENAGTERPNLVLDRKEIDQLCSMIFVGDRQACEKIFHGLTKKLRELSYVDWSSLSCFCFYWFSALLSRLCEEKGQQSEAPLDLLVQYQTELSVCRTVEELQMLFSSVLDDFLRIFSKEASSQNRRLIREVFSCLNAHYAEPITIQGIARELYVTPAYLCRLFKKETTQTINGALTALRIKKAQELLEQHRYRVYELAPMVGYQDVKYFSRVFKAHLGMTPGEYADRFGKNGTGEGEDL